MNRFVLCQLRRFALYYSRGLKVFAVLAALFASIEFSYGELAGLEDFKEANQKVSAEITTLRTEFESVDSAEAVARVLDRITTAFESCVLNLVEFAKKNPELLKMSTPPKELAGEMDAMGKLMKDLFQGATASKPVFRKYANEKVVMAALDRLETVGYTLADKDYFSRALGVPIEPEVNEEWNFKMQRPAGWARVEAGKFGDACRLALDYRNKVGAMVTAERLEGASLSTCVDLVKRLFRNDGGEITSERSETIQGLEAVCLESRKEKEGAAFAYVQWLFLHNGTFYQQITWGKQEATELVHEESRKLIEALQIIDPKKVVVATVKPSSLVYESPRHAFRVDLRNTKWNRSWDRLRMDFPSAEVGMMHFSGSDYFAVIPVWLGTHVPDKAALLTAMAAYMGIPYPDPGVDGVKDWTQKGPKGTAIGRALTYEQTTGETSSLYRLRALQFGSMGYCLVSWHVKKTDAVEDVVDVKIRLDEALDAVGFFPGALSASKSADENARETQTIAIIHNRIGAWYDEKGLFEDAMSWYQTALEMRSNENIVAGNYVRAAVEAGKAPEGLAFLDKLISRAPNDLKLQARRADLQFQSGDTKGSLESYGKLFEQGFRNDTALAGVLRLLTDQGRNAEALEMLDKYAAGHETLVLKKLRVGIFQAKGDYPQALQGLEEILKSTPNDLEAGILNAECLLGAERLTDALSQTTQLIQTHAGMGYLYRLKGMVEFRLKRYREAKASMELACAKAPLDSDSKRWLEHLSGILGEGANSAIKKVLEPVPISAELQTIPTEEGAAEYLAGFGAWYPLQVKAIDCQKECELRTTERHIIKVLDQTNVERFSTLEFFFDPLGEEIYVNSLTVKDGAGEVVGTGNVESYYVVDEGADQMATQGKVLHVPVPGLKPGCTIDYVVTRLERGWKEGVPFRMQLFARGLPILKSVFCVAASEEKLKWGSTFGLTPRRESEASVWVVEKPTVYRNEPLQAQIHDFLPIVWIGDSHSTWTKEAEQYLDLIKDRLTSEESVQQLAERECRDLATAEEKIAALARYVQRSLTYKAIEFGRRARVPNAPSQTLRNKYGDCKDHALLLAQLLKSVGVPASLALISNGNVLQPELPSLDQFNHVVVYVPNEQGGRFLDCTNKAGNVLQQPPTGLAKQMALVLDPKDPRLISVADYAAHSSSIEADRQIHVEEDQIAVKEHVVFQGTSAEWLRSVLQKVDSANRNRYLTQLMNPFLQHLELREVKVQNLDRTEAPMDLKLEYKVGQTFHKVGDQLVGQIPAVWEQIFLAPGSVDKRKTPFRLWVPVELKNSVTVEAPEQWEFVSPDSKNVDTAYCQTQSKAWLSDGKFFNAGTISQRIGLFGPVEYHAFSEAMHTAIATSERTLVLKRKDK